MRSALRSNTSPAMAVAFIALLAALSGTAIALPGKNKVDKNDVRKNAIGAKQIRAGTVASSEAKNNALRGTDINESTLGQVPSASQAGNASTLQGATPSAFQPASKQLRFGVVSMDPGDSDRTIGTFGPFTLRAECDAGPDGRLTLITTESNSDVDSDEDSDNDFDAGEDFPASEGEDEDDEINAASPGGTSITGQLYTSDDGTGLGGGCDFWGEVTTTSG